MKEGSRVPELLRSMAHGIHDVLARQYKDLIKVSKKELDELANVTGKLDLTVINFYFCLI